MIWQKYKPFVKLLELVFTILGPFLKITNVDRLIIITTIFKSPQSSYFQALYLDHIG